MMKYWVYVHNFETKCSLGIYPKEKKTPQRVRINVSLEVVVTKHEDSIYKVLSYEDIIKITEIVTSKKHRYLAETVAENIADSCLKLKNTISVSVDLKKPDIIKGGASVGVKIHKVNKNIK